MNNDFTPINSKSLKEVLSPVSKDKEMELEKLYGPTYIDETTGRIFYRDKMIELAKEWAKPLGYIAFTDEKGNSATFGTNDLNLVTNKGASFQTYEKTTAYFGDKGAIKSLRGSVTNESLYQFVKYFEALLTIEDGKYLSYALDIDWVVCPECGEIVYIPEGRLEDILCTACDHILAKGNIDPANSVDVGDFTNLDAVTNNMLYSITSLDD